MRLSSPSVNEMRTSAYKTSPRPRAGGFVQIGAFSKINLILDILRKRPDGYHDLRTVMQTLALHDNLTISVPSAQTAKFILECSDPNLPTDARNLVTQAALYMIQEYGITQPVRIQLEKRIPAAAGLAGGSSDCAATITGLNDLFNLHIPLHSDNQPSLMEIGQRFGADVPFCLQGGTALAEGIGEKLTPLTPHPHCWVVLACPDIHVSTAEIFDKFRSGTAPASNIAAMQEALALGDLQQIAANLSNDLTQVTTKIYPEIQILIDDMKTAGAMGASMSGSGPTVFGYFSNKEKAEKAQEKMKNITGRAFLTEIACYDTDSN